MKLVVFTRRVVTAAVAVLPLIALAQGANTIKIGKETKRTVAVVKELSTSMSRV